MSSTRTAQDDSTFHQGRYASAPEFERGLLGNLVAKRVALLDARSDRELLWFLHYLSHKEEGGLAAVARDLIAIYPERTGTTAMHANGKSGQQEFTADELRQIKLEMPRDVRELLFVRGELSQEEKSNLGYLNRQLAQAELSETDESGLEVARQIKDLKDLIASSQKAAELSAAKHPQNHTAAGVQKICSQAALGQLNQSERSTETLGDVLRDLCLDPSRDLSGACPWYFSGLIEVLREYHLRWITTHKGGAETKLGKIVAEEFDRAWNMRCLILLEGDPRRGKSFAGQKCCQLNPGKARFVEVPPGSDDTSFYRALARGLGIGNFLKYKAIDIRERVESVLLSGDLILVLDEAQRLWPERSQRYAHPTRINWVMYLANHKVPILLISTPQFLTRQKIAETTGWNSAQLTGRIARHVPLPCNLDDSDLIGIGKSMLPEASAHDLKAMAIYAKVSDRYLSAIEFIAQDASYRAKQAGRDRCNSADIAAAMVGLRPSDNRLNSALEKKNVEGSRRRLPAAPVVEPPPIMGSHSRTAFIGGHDRNPGGLITSKEEK